jgi:hypothetical protein
LRVSSHRNGHGAARAEADLSQAGSTWSKLFHVEQSAPNGNVFGEPVGKLLIARHFHLQELWCFVHRYSEWYFSRRTGRGTIAERSDARRDQVSRNGLTAFVLIPGMALPLLR